MRQVSILTASLGFAVSVLGICTGVSRPEFADGLFGFMFVVIVCACIAHGKSRLHFGDIYGGCHWWAFAINILLVVLFLPMMMESSGNDGFCAEMFPPLYWMLCCAAYSAP